MDRKITAAESENVYLSKYLKTLKFILFAAILYMIVQTIGAAAGSGIGYVYV